MARSLPTPEGMHHGYRTRRRRSGRIGFRRLGVGLPAGAGGPLGGAARAWAAVSAGQLPAYATRTRPGVLGPERGSVRAVRRVAVLRVRLTRVERPRRRFAHLRERAAAQGREM